ncbi:MAG TPA: DUF4282 domain-containing protein [Coxiellaceae bacterium]|nr:DUF4282 domain-containing protein [Coxiellaceae bacterium]
MKDFLCFRTMLTPLLLQVVFWLSLVFCLFAGIYVMLVNHNISIGLQILILGPLSTRVFCEITIIIFRINDNLKTISHQLAKTDPNA